MRLKKKLDSQRRYALKVQHGLIHELQVSVLKLLNNGGKSLRLSGKKENQAATSHNDSLRFGAQIKPKMEPQTSRSSCRHTCLKLQVPSTSGPQQIESIFVKGDWFDSHFTLSITDGRDAWVCHASEEDVKERAGRWDQPVAEYVELAERYLGFQQPDSLYGFSDAGNGHRRLTWTFKKEGTNLEWRWRFKPSSNSKETTTEILDFLMDANIRLSEEVVRKTQASDRLKEEAEKCLAQSERLASEKDEFESEVYAKFVNILNSKKAKLRELRDRLSKQQSTGKSPEEEESTEPLDAETDNENHGEKPFKDLAGTSKHVPGERTRGRKRAQEAGACGILLHAPDGFVPSPVPPPTSPASVSYINIVSAPGLCSHVKFYSEVAANVFASRKDSYAVKVLAILSIHPTNEVQ
ncbi:hypothetical protein Nepgr_030347 [Nepenthes gracilis]|uniref:DNA repair protein XRCC4 n=1 Tax=Nepenthes gracilis TaxID=150966 RepID=A0AAD3TG52_NEPGR|nr:hypothetical protein Nepgr_030347 [Nepenthes gracilis]